MIGFIKRLLRDRRGNALIIAGLSLPLVVGAAGLGTDTVQWVVWKRELQRAADSAAFAGVYAQVQDNAAMTADQAVSNDLDTNNHTKVSLLAGFPQVTFPNGAGWTNAVRVTLAVRRPLGFSGLFLSTPPTIVTSATAALVEDGSYCVVALAPNGSALQIAGSANVQMGCGAISNSEDPLHAVGINGNSHNFVAEPVSAAGGITSTVNGAPDVRSYQIPMEDPYADLSTDIPPTAPCTNINHPDKVVSETGPQNGGTTTLRPGCYNNFNLGNRTYDLQPGTYYLDSTSLRLDGQTRLTGEGVTVILTGSNPGSVDMRGESMMDLTAPTTGEYANMVLIQSPNATTGNNNIINGDNNTALDGAIYFPRGDLTFSGSTGQAFQCAMVVGYTVEFTGSATVQNSLIRPDGTPCRADTQVTGQRVRLVA